MGQLQPLLAALLPPDAIDDVLGAGGGKLVLHCTRSQALCRSFFLGAGGAPPGWELRHPPWMTLPMKQTNTVLPNLVA
jgi:hypothetical protein